MKKNIFYLAIVILGIMQVQTIQAQMLGKWIIPTTFIGWPDNSYELTFYENSISSTPITPLLPVQDVPTEFSAGGYNNNYDTEFYVLGKNLYLGDPDNNWWPYLNKPLHPDYSIIRKPQSSNEYYSFFSHYVHHSLSVLSYNTLTHNESTGKTSATGETILRNFDWDYASHAISKEQNVPRYIYIASIQGDNNDPDAGVYRWTISNSGITNQTMIIEAGSSDLNNNDFDAYTLELNMHSNETILAWINGIEDDEPIRPVDRIIIVKNGNHEIYDLDHGRIGGIEFSSEENVLYASCTDVGIVKVDYTVFNNPVYTTIPGSSNYSHTSLQTAPNGHIYGVSNDGMQLCQINTQTGDFIATNVFQFDHPVSTYVEFWVNGIDVKYYILPKNERQYNALNVSILAENTECPEDPFGEVTIYVSGGVPFGSPDDPYIITSDDDIDFEWDEVQEAFIADGLTAGIYSFVVLDNGENSIPGSFVIKPTYDFEISFLYIEEDTEFPSTAYPETNYTFEKGIYIHADPENGITPTLTINNSTFEFALGAKIIIEPGAKLIVNNSVLTNWHCLPDEMWEGIEVWGNSGESQTPVPGEPCEQGKLVLDNATIQNAILAVDLWKPNDYSKTGGIVIADDAHFINNTRALRAFYYDNEHPTNPNVILDNLSHFYKCDFDINTEYLGSQTFYKHIDLSNVKGFSFRGCYFTNTATNNISEWNSAIMTMDAGFTVENYDHIPPIESNLSGFYTAIWAANERTTHTFLVQDANFVNNAIGIKVNAVNNVAVISSNFNLGLSKNPFAKEICFDTDISYGIDITYSHSFAIEDNNFTTSQTTGEYIGVRVLESNTDFDLIYNNTYAGLSQGNRAEGDNRLIDDDDIDGLEYQCNENIGNEIDFIVTAEQPLRAKIKTSMGSTTLASGNTFTNDVYAMHFINNGLQTVNYFWCDLSECEFQEPLYYNTVNYFQPIDVSISNGCLPHYGGGGIEIRLSDDEIIQKESEFTESLNNYNSVLSLFESLEDGGNTTGELLDITSAQPGDTWELRAQLLSHSPYLSKEVLTEASNKTNVLPEGVLFDILSANPDELRNADLISHLENKEQPLPNYMIGILQQIAGGITAKTVLKMEMAEYHSRKSIAAYDIIRSILNDSISSNDNLRLWLGNLQSYSADRQIISSWLQEGNTSDALSLLNLLPSLYDLQNEELIAYNDYSQIVNLQIVLQNQNRNIMQLNENEIADLTQLASNGLGVAQRKAKSILEYAYGSHYFDCPCNDTLTSKSAYASPKYNYVENGLFIEAYPSPASTWVSFNYCLPLNEKEAYIAISDVNGKTIHNITLSGNRGQKVVDIRKMTNGIWFYTIHAGSLNKSGKLIIQH